METHGGHQAHAYSEETWTGVYHKESVRKFVGQWVQCHSTYGVHHGVLHRALHDGIILVHHTQLAAFEGSQKPNPEFSLHSSEDGLEADLAQFFLPAPGLFIPYGGMFGLWPRPIFPI